MDSFSVKAVQKLSGINSNTLKAWERRYGAVTPSRHDNGRRSYSREDLVRIKLLSQLVEQGHSIATIASKETEQLRGLLSAIGEMSALDFHLTDETKNEISNSHVKKFIDCLERYDIDSVSVMLSGIRLQCSARDFVLREILPLLTEVGSRVDKGQLSIAHEHTMSALIKSELMNILYTMTRSLRDIQTNIGKLSVTISGMEGDIHEFGILSAAILVASQGWRPFYIGPNLPAHALIQAAKSIKSQIVMLGSTRLDPGSLKMSINDYIAILDEKLPAHTQIWLGGWLDSSIQKSGRKRVIRHIPSLELLNKAIIEFK